MPEEVFELTYAGIKELQHELDERKTVTSIEIAERLKEARSLGDLSENSEYDDAKEAQAKNEMRIAEIENILKKARLIEEDKISKDEVTLGSLVEIEDVERGEVQEYMLVSEKEEDIFKNKISSGSPVGAAILGHKEGETVGVRTPAGIINYKILRISRPEAYQG
ncbi:MAG: transcription elongation factor GreA [Eubacteriales bacterium]|nr:transcription elongation factor GreA [Eubacteriales bacterium]